MLGFHKFGLAPRSLKAMTGAMAVVLATPFAISQSVEAATATTHAAVTFSDINQSYAKQQILDLARVGVLSGMGGGIFAPTGSITYDQFYVILAKSFQLAPDTSNLEPQVMGDAGGIYTPFPNTAGWARPYLNALVNHNHNPGGQDEKNSGQPITREEMIVKMLNSLGLGNQAQHDGIATTFSDADQISADARPYVALAQQIGLIHGMPDGQGGYKFDPQAVLQRQEVALLAHDYYFGEDTFLTTGQAFVKKQPSLLFQQFASNVQLLGTGSANGKVALTINDGRQVYHRTETVRQDGTFELSTFDMALLKSGQVDVAAVYTDAAGNTVGNASLSFAMPVLSNVLPGSRVGNNETVTKENQTAYVMYGVADPHESLRPCAMDQQGHVVEAQPVTSGADGAWQTTIDLSSLPDGTIFLFGDTSSDSQNMGAPYLMNLSVEVTKATN